jgi:hypothetical protein
VQAQQPEHPRRLGAELVAGPGEYRPHARAQVAGIQGIQAPGRIGELGGHGGERKAGTDGGSGSGDRQRQRQARAQPGDPVDCGGLGGGAAVAEPGGEQLHGFAVRQDVEGEHPGAVGGGQAAQLIPAGDQHQAARARWQQGPHLLLVAGVVQNDQHPPIRQQAAVQSCLCLRAPRDPRGRNAESVQESAHCLAGRGRRAGRVVAAQVHVQLPVRELACRLVSPVDGQRSLAYPRRSADHDDRHRSRLLGADLAEQPGQGC